MAALTLMTPGLRHPRIRLIAWQDRIEGP